MAKFSTKCKPNDPKAPCKFALVEVRVYFQHFPGTHGTNAERGINDVAYKYESAAVADSGKTAVDGVVVMKLRVGETKVKLTIFSTTYEITLVPTIEAVTTLKGLQWRLDLLGYEPGKIDGTLGKRTDFATLVFQANNPPLDTTGVTSAAVQTQLTAQAGV